MTALYHVDSTMLEFDEEVVACESAGDGLWKVTLTNTAFYPTGGGQPCDAGTLNGCPVVDVIEEEEGKPIVHVVRSDEPLRGVVHGVIDAQRRRDHTQQHSGQHLLSHVLYERFGAYSLGLHIGAQDAYVDLLDSGFALTREVCDEIESEVNAWIARDERVKCFFPDEEELKLLPLRKKPDAHEALRIVWIGEDEAVACCGTHVTSTSQVQMVHVLSWQKSHGNVRIFFVAGERAVAYAQQRIAAADSAAKLFSCGVNDVMPAIEKLQRSNADLAHELAALRRELVLSKLEALQPEALEKGDLYVACLAGADDAQLKDGISAMTKRNERALCLLVAPAGAQYAAALSVGAQCKVHAGNALKSVLSALGGKGGGRPDSAFGRCNAWEEATARDILRAALQ